MLPAKSGKQKPQADEDRPPACPKCKSPDVARIIYGKPPLTREVLDGLDSGRIVAGGCLVPRRAPAWRCNRCNRDFGRQA